MRLWHLIYLTSFVGVVGQGKWPPTWKWPKVDCQGVPGCPSFPCDVAAGETWKLAWVGDGSCEDGNNPFGVSFACKQFEFDDGDCPSTVAPTPLPTYKPSKVPTQPPSVFPTKAPQFPMSLTVEEDVQVQWQLLLAGGLLGLIAFGVGCYKLRKLPSQPTEEELKAQMEGMAHNVEVPAGAPLSAMVNQVKHEDQLVWEAYNTADGITMMPAVIPVEMGGMSQQLTTEEAGYLVNHEDVAYGRPIAPQLLQAGIQIPANGYPPSEYEQSLILVEPEAVDGRRIPQATTSTITSDQRDTLALPKHSMMSTSSGSTASVSTNTQSLISLHSITNPRYESSGMSSRNTELNF